MMFVAGPDGPREDWQKDGDLNPTYGVRPVHHKL